MPNTTTNILDKILAAGLVTLREAAVMPRLCNTDYQGEAKSQGDTIDIPRPVIQVVSTVTASNTSKAAADKAPSKIQVSLDQWKMTDFHMTDKEVSEMDRNRHFVPMQVAESARALANNIDAKIHADYTGIYGYVGTAGTAPFTAVSDATGARRELNEQLAPMSDRRVVLDPAAEDKALQLAAYRDISQTGDRSVPIEGEMGRKFGMDHFMSQNVGSHTTGSLVSAQVGSTTAVGASSLAINALTAGGAVVVGDIFTIAGDTQTYVVQGAVTFVSTVEQNISINPTLKVAASDTSVVQFKGTHTVNLAFNRGAFVYVTRPIQDSVGEMTGGNPQSVLVDNQTGLSMRLEVVRQHKQNAWQFDLLYGTKLVRPEFAVRIAG